MLPTCECCHGYQEEVQCLSSPLVGGQEKDVPKTAWCCQLGAITAQPKERVVLVRKLGRFFIINIHTWQNLVVNKKYKLNPKMLLFVFSSLT